MAFRKTTFGALAITVLTVAACAQEKPATIVSPAPDMPAEWFYDNGLHVTPAQRELVGKHVPMLKIGKWYQGELKPEDLKGKVVLIDFWATWCAPCRVAMPHTDEMAKKLKDKGFVALSICVEGNEAEVAPFIAEKKLTMPVAWDDNMQSYAAFGGDSGYPTYALIDRKGTVRAIGLSAEHVEKAVEKLLAEK